jgi:hypothetical protein
VDRVSVGAENGTRPFELAHERKHLLPRCPLGEFGALLGLDLPLGGEGATV